MYENIRVPPPPPRVVGGVGRSRVRESGEDPGWNLSYIVPVVAQFSSIGYLSV